MLLFVSLLSAFVAIAGVQDVSVDCDHGGDLARVMRSLANEALPASRSMRRETSIASQSL